jgi:hypothetical protein
MVTKDILVDLAIFIIISNLNIAIPDGRRNEYNQIFTDS